MPAGGDPVAQSLEKMGSFPFTHGADQGRFTHQVLDIFIHVGSKSYIAGMDDIDHAVDEKGDHASIQHSQNGVVTQDHLIEIQAEFTQGTAVIVRGFMLIPFSCHSFKVVNQPVHAVIYQQHILFFPIASFLLKPTSMAW